MRLPGLRSTKTRVEGVEIATPEPAAESTNIVDLMKLLEASVKAATDVKTAGSPEPVSVADAKKERASRPAKAKAEASKPAAAKSTTRKAASAKADDEDEAAEARPARRRKTA